MKPLRKRDAPLIQDDEGHLWRFWKGRIGIIGDQTRNDDYPCASFEEGVRLLREYGYIGGGG